jgi:hypothetical protein
MMIEEPLVRALIPHRIGAVLLDDDTEPGHIHLWLSDSKYRVEFFVNTEAVSDEEYVEHWVRQVVKVFDKKRGRE